MHTDVYPPAIFSPPCVIQVTTYGIRPQCQSKARLSSCILLHPSIHSPSFQTPLLPPPSTANTIDLLTYLLFFLHPSILPSFISTLLLLLSIIQVTLASVYEAKPDPSLLFPAPDSVSFQRHDGPVHSLDCSPFHRSVPFNHSFMRVCVLASRGMTGPCTRSSVSWTVQANQT